jgi:CheY-like chemotaxis protein
MPSCPTCLVVRLTIALSLCVFAASLPAQDIKPKEATPATEAEPTPENPAVEAILATHPTTPAECIRAAKTLVGLGAPQAAKPLVKKVIDAKLDPQQLADLGIQFDMPVFLDLASQSVLQPESKQLADAVEAAMTARLHDTKRIEGLIAQLQDASEEKRLEALKELQEARGASIGPLLSVFSDPKRTHEYQNVRTVLAGMGRPARDALIAMLDSGDAKLQVQAIQALLEINDSRAAIDLIEPSLSKQGDAEVRAAAAAALQQLTGHIPTPSEAINRLTDAAQNHFHRRQPIEGENNDRMELWHWDTGLHQSVATTGTPDDAARQLAARYAREAYRLAPENRDVQLLYITAMLDVAAYANGLDKPLDEKAPAIVEAKQLAPQTIDAVLRYAIEHHHPAAATVAAQLLGQIGKADELLYQGSAPAPLILAVQNPDRRLRMAALKTIVQLQPTKPYAGSSYVPSALGYFAASSGVRKALVGGPNLEQARTLAGMLAASGFEADTVGSGKELLLMATRSPDYELAIIDVGIEHPQISTLMQELRRDPRTALLRVGLVARDGHAELAEQVAHNDAMSAAFARPHDEQAVRWQLAQLTAIAPDELVDFAVRQQQAVEALDLLTKLSQSANKLYNLRNVQDAVLTALYNPKLSLKAVPILADMNSSEAQRALVEAASRFTLPLELRKAAASAFRKNTQQFGILLTTDEIRRQYDRYNESEKLDAASQQLLGLILDCLEVPTEKTK